MFRIIFYILIVVIFSIGVYLKIGVIQEKRNIPTVSILNERLHHGKPVEVYETQKEDLHFYERATGEFLNGRVEIYLSKIQWQKIKVGQAARIIQASNEIENGKVASISQQSDNQTGLYKVFVGPDNLKKFSNGQNVVVDINVDTINNVIKIPSAAVEQTKKQNYVWVLDNNKAFKKDIKLGLESENYIQVANGLNVGENVIVRGADALEKGDLVRIVSGGAKK